MVDTVVRGGSVLIEGTGFIRAFVAVQDGVIVQVGEELQDVPPAKHVVDADGLHVIPGLIDTHSHFRDPGLTHKEDYETGTRGAALGGVTMTVDMPNTDPVPNTVERFRAHRANAGSKAVVDFNHWASPTIPEEIPGIAAEGAAGFKFFMISQHYPYDNPGQFISLSEPYRIYQTMSEIAKVGLPCLVHPHNQDMWSKLTELYVGSGRTSPVDREEAYCFADNFVQKSAIATLFFLSKATGCDLRILHNNYPPVLEFVRTMKAAGFAATIEQNPWAIFGKGIPGWEFDNPDAIWRSLTDGTVDIIATDHAPHATDELMVSRSDAFNSIVSSLTVIEHMLPLYLTEIDKGAPFTLERLVQLLSSNVARHLGVYPRKGALSVGSDADLVLLDLDKTAVIDASKIQSKCKNTPYDGYKLKGIPVRTMVRGRTVAEDGEILVDPGFGEFVKRGR
jgi:dihydroorotase-like cyclic amidohydrolase